MKAAGQGIKRGFSSPGSSQAGSTGGSVTHSPDRTTRIIGQTGAQVIAGPNGMTLIGGKAEDEGAAEARRGEEEARQGTIEGLRGSAVAYRSNADEMERQASGSGMPIDVRDSLMAQARNFRVLAKNLEEQANKLSAT